jgi:hypothetical protein
MRCPECNREVKSLKQTSSKKFGDSSGIFYCCSNCYERIIRNTNGEIIGLMTESLYKEKILDPLTAETIRKMKQIKKV